MNPTRMLGILLAGALLAGCASTRVERSRRPLATGSGTYFMNRMQQTERQGGGTLSFSRFYYGSSDFYRSEVFSIGKVEGERGSYYQLTIDLVGGDWRNLRSVLIKADGMAFRLTDPESWTSHLPAGAIRWTERYRFRLDPLLVSSLRNAKVIRIQDVVSPITLTPRQRSVLQSFLRDTSGAS